MRPSSHSRESRHPRLHVEREPKERERERVRETGTHITHLHFTRTTSTFLSLSFSGTHQFIPLGSIQPTVAVLILMPSCVYGTDIKFGFHRKTQVAWGRALIINRTLKFDISRNSLRNWEYSSLPTGHLWAPRVACLTLYCHCWCMLTFFNSS